MKNGMSLLGWRSSLPSSCAMEFSASRRGGCEQGLGEDVKLLICWALWNLQAVQLVLDGHGIHVLVPVPCIQQGPHNDLIGCLL